MDILKEIHDKIYEEVFSTINPADYGWSSENFEERAKGRIAKEIYFTYENYFSPNPATLFDYFYEFNNLKSNDIDEIKKEIWDKYLVFLHYLDDQTGKDSDFFLLMANYYKVPEEKQTPEFKEKLLAYKEKISYKK